MTVELIRRVGTRTAEGPFGLLRDRAWMLFVDGENFAKAGERALKAAGVSPIAGPNWRRSVFLWAPAVRGAHWGAIEPFTTGQNLFSGTWPAADLRRAYYYTSDTADEPEWTDTRLAIRALGFEPRLFKRRQGRSKAVDIALATDVLVLGAAGQYEAAIIAAGDGDYVPLMEAVKRLGLQVGVAFPATDTNPELRIAADAFVDLEEPLVKAWRPLSRQASSGRAPSIECRSRGTRDQERPLKRPENPMKGRRGCSGSLSGSVLGAGGRTLIERLF